MVIFLCSLKLYWIVYLTLIEVAVFVISAYEEFIFVTDGFKTP